MPWWGILLIVLGALLLIGICVAAWWVSTFNKLVAMKNDVDEAFSTMDVYMKKRYDIIPNLVETVKGYAKHEKQALEDVMKARYSSMTANTPEEKAKNENWLSGTLKTLFSISENYPDLKANQSFQNLMESLKNIETEIANARKYYNAVVKNFNTKIEMFPSSFVARKHKFEKRVLFEIDDASERQAPKVEF